MSPIARRVRREMTLLARIRRHIQKLSPYQSLLLLMVPVALVEPFKIVALFVAGKGHWFSGTAMICMAYAVSLLVIERLFRIVRPKLVMMSWFATIWDFATKLRRGVISALFSSPNPRPSIDG
jgi:hypothetical protein